MGGGSSRCVAGLVWRYGGVAARHRSRVGAQRGGGVLQRRWDGARVNGRAREALMAGSGRSEGTASGSRPSAASAAVDRENRGGRERRK